MHSFAFVDTVVCLQFKGLKGRKDLVGSEGKARRTRQSRILHDARDFPPRFFFPLRSFAPMRQTFPFAFILARHFLFRNRRKPCTVTDDKQRIARDFQAAPKSLKVKATLRKKIFSNSSRTAPAEFV